MSYNPDGRPYSIELSAEEGGRLVFANIDNPALVPIPESAVYDALKASRWNSYAPLPEHISQVGHSHQMHLRKLSKAIAERRDGRVHINISPDAFEAYLTVEPPAGGAPVAPTAIRLALAQSGTKSGIDTDALTRVEVTGKAARIIIARGKAPKTGRDAVFEVLFSMEAPESKQASEDSSADEDTQPLRAFAVIDAGTPLMRRTPARAGERGFKVTGEILFPPTVNDSRLVVSPGSRIVEGNPDLLIAARTGTPIVLPNTVRVDEVKTIPMANASTGPCVHDGSIFIRGGVGTDGYVEAVGSVKVSGGVEAAIIKAGGDIEIHFGCHGRGSGEIHADKGVVRGRFFDQTTIAAHDLLVTDSLSGCDVTAGNAIQVGVTQGKGHLYGGRLRALSMIKANIIGSSTGSETVLEVGVSRAVMEKVEEIRKEMSATRELLAGLSKSKEQISRLTYRFMEHQLKLLDEQYRRAHTRHHALEVDEAKLVSLLQKMGDAMVIVQKKIYPGVTISISGREFIVKDEFGPSRFLLKKNAVEREPLP